MSFKISYLTRLV